MIADPIKGAFTCANVTGGVVCRVFEKTFLNSTNKALAI
jgi:hypothetical protein